MENLTTLRERAEYLDASQPSQTSRSDQETFKKAMVVDVSGEQERMFS